MWRLPQDDRGNGGLRAVFRDLQPAPAEARLHQNFLDGFFADAVVERPPAGKAAGEDVESVRERRFHADGFTHGRNHDRGVHSKTPLVFSTSSLNAANASSQKVSSQSRNSVRPSRRSE